MSLQGQQTKAFFQRARDVFPYGVNSNFRYWGEEDTLIISRAHGPYLWDADDKRYIDYRLAFGPIILGHAHEKVVNAVAEAIKHGTQFAFTNTLEVEAGEWVKRLTGIDKIRFTNSGTEATMHALRVARAYTGREKIIKFEGAYHGVHDYVLFTTANTPSSVAGSRRSPLTVPVSSGIPKGLADYVVMAPYNDIERLEEIVAQTWQDVAAIIVEPILGNVGGVMPVPGFLEKLREVCDTYGIVLIFDEVKTGFRLANGGAQEFFNIKADLVTYAKSMGNGFQVAAFGGKEKVMMTIEPGKMIHTGTYNGNGVGMAAVVATMQILEKEAVIEKVFEQGTTLMNGIDGILTRLNVPHIMTGSPTMFGLALGIEEAPRDFREFDKVDDHLYEHFTTELAYRGVLPELDCREPWFMCLAHDEAVIHETLNIVEDTAKEFFKK
ncbi:MAG: glutamate-1-semialdehyde 2,1-aminomutase [Anaerolineales bacterium]